MLLGAETAASRTCRVKPYISRRGKFSVTRYTSVTRAIAFCHAMRSRNESILVVLLIADSRELTAITAAQRHQERTALSRRAVPARSDTHPRYREGGRWRA